MAVFRVNKTADYTVMSNFHLRDKRLNLKSKGLLSMVLSLPDDWSYTIGGLVAICRESESAVKSALKELKKYGYLRIDKVKPNKENGGRYEYIYNIFEQPHKKQTEEIQGVENQPLENQAVENNPLYKDTNLSNTDIQNTNISSKNDILAEFETLWKMYPRKQGKTKALKAYQKAIKDGVSFETVEQGIKAYCEYIKKNKVKGEYIKHGSTWFNGYCWNDEYTTKKPETEDNKKYGGTYL